MHSGVERAREALMVSNALYMGRIANHVLSRTIRELYDATMNDFKKIVPKQVLCRWMARISYSKNEGFWCFGPHVRLLL